MLTAIWVTSPYDNMEPDGQITLREALYAANHDVSVDGSPAGSGLDHIVFLPIVLEGNEPTIGLIDGSLEILDDVRIIGPGPDQLKIDAEGRSRVFAVARGVSAELSGLTITGGSAVSGGGISCEASTLVLSDLALSGNSASLAGGGIFSSGSTVTLSDVIVSNNSASQGGGIDGVSSKWMIVDSTISGNVVSGFGGGIAGSGDWTITGSTISGNLIDGDELLGDGGGISGAGRWTISDTMIVSNWAGRSGRGGGIFGSGEWNVTDSTISGNCAGYGGGISIPLGTGPWTISGSTIDSNYVWHDGGGIHSGGTLTADNTTISRNRAEHDGGGIWTEYASPSMLGNVTISGNSAGDRGGGIFCVGPLVAVNATIAENVAHNGVACPSPGSGGGVFAVGIGRATLYNTIVARNHLPAPGTWHPDDVFGDFNRDSAYNLIRAIDHSLGLDGEGTQWGTADAPLDALTMFEPLGHYGGPTETHALLPNSLALDAGLNGAAFWAGLTTDQRGLERFMDGNGDGDIIVDIGAYEAGTFRVSTTSDEDDGNYGPNDLSLREAIALAALVPGEDVITLDSPRSGRATFELSQGTLIIDSDVSIQGPGADRLAIDAAGTGRVFCVAEGVTASISGLNLTGGRAFAYVGPWFVPLPGGGIYNEGSLTLSEVAVTGNVATSSGGGIYNVGTLTLQDSTISGNEAWWNGGGLSGSGSWSIANTTVSGNAARRHGGGISAAGGVWKINNATIADNRADSDNNRTGRGGGLHVASGTNAIVHSTIVAGNHRRRGLDDARGVFDQVSSYNLIGVINGSKGLDGKATQYGTAFRPLDAMLAPLGDYGGPTQTHALMPGGPAVDRGYNPLGLAYDQRGEARTSARGTDIGAFELQARGYLLGSVGIEDRAMAGTLTGHSLRKTDPTPNGTSNNLSATDSAGRSPGRTPGIGLDRDYSRGVDKVFELQGVSDWLMLGIEDIALEMRERQTESFSLAGALRS